VIGVPVALLGVANGSPAALAEVVLGGADADELVLAGADADGLVLVGADADWLVLDAEALVAAVDEAPEPFEELEHAASSEKAAAAAPQRTRNLRFIRVPFIERRATRRSRVIPVPEARDRFCPPPKAAGSL
jgi:hypothetical protein